MNLPLPAKRSEEYPCYFVAAIRASLLIRARTACARSAPHARHHSLGPLVVCFSALSRAASDH